ncbi:MAG: type II 3-dehydroquinate dehydratase [Marinifilaceae bacterium]|jgi:3-dehydroquinate dehydratase-2|nr:type II 3-dehydroquinate dehydratase [Marinifilaceae bacterium]
MKVLIINGPNLNMLGRREKEIYGNVSFETYLEYLKEEFQMINIQYFQSNIEGEIVDKLQAVGFDYDAILLNAGAYTHTSIAIRDAITLISAPVIEIHISNILNRESFRHKSVIGSECRGSIIGFGLNSYKLGLQSLL